MGELAEKDAGGRWYYGADLMITPSLSVSDLKRIEVRLLSLPSITGLATAHDPTPPQDRLLVVVGVETGDGTVGWGECSALNRPTYTSEWAEDSFDVLSRAIAEGGRWPDPSTHPMAAAAAGMALLDAELRNGGQSLADRLGASAQTVKAGATIGILPVAESIASVASLVDSGYERVKVKIDPSQVDLVAHELSHEFTDLEIHVDANGSLDESHLMELLALADHGVKVVEQPFAVDRADLTAEFMAVTSSLVFADEAVGSVEDAASLLKAEALGGVAIKPPRLGGLAAAGSLLDWCRNNNVPASVGGMLEGGLGRHALAAFAACDGFTVTGDLSPAGLWLQTNPWPDLEMVDGQITVPVGPGVAPLPEPTVLDRFTVRRTERIL